MSTTSTLMEGLVPLVGASPHFGRQQEVTRLLRCEEEAREVREARRLEGLPAPSLLFLSMTQRCDLSCARCSTARYPWSDDAPVEAANRALSEAERSGVSFAVLTGCGRWMDPSLFDLLRVHDRQVLMLVARPSEIDAAAAEQIASLPHVLPFLFAAEAGAGFCEGRDLASTQTAVASLRSRRVPFGFAVSANAQNLPYLMGLEFYNDCFEGNAQFGLVLDCMRRKGRGCACTPLSADDRGQLASHIAQVRSRTGGFLAFLPWGEASGGWCVAAPRPVEGGPPGSPPIELLHVSPSHHATGPIEPFASRLFEGLRIASMGPAAAAKVG